MQIDTCPTTDFLNLSLADAVKSKLETAEGYYIMRAHYYDTQAYCYSVILVH